MTISNEALDHMLAVSRMMSRSNRMDDGAFLGKIYFESRSHAVADHAKPEMNSGLRHISFKQAALRQLTDDDKLQRLPDKFVDLKCRSLQAESSSHSDKLSCEFDVRQALERLDDDQRRIALAIMNNCTLQEIASEFGMTRQAIHKKWKRAKVALKEYLQGYKHEN